MSGLNPSGLGQSERFNNTESGSVSTGNLAANNVVLNSNIASDISTHSGDAVTISGNSEQVIFSGEEPRDVIGGKVIGGVARDLEYVFDKSDNIVIDQSSILTRGETRGGDEFTVLNVLPAKDVVELRFENAISNNTVAGWEVITI